MGEERLIEGYKVSHLLNVARRAVAEKTQNSVLMDEKAEEQIPKFDFSELKIGKVLGRGGFCVVQEISGIVLKQGDEDKSTHSTKEDDEQKIHNIVQDRSFMAAHFLRRGKDFRYAFKTMKKSSSETAQHYVNAVVDLAMEARFLAVIRHPNIIKMRATSGSSPFDGEYFIVLDKLYDILITRLKTWKKKLPGALARLTGSAKSQKVKDFWAERLTVCYDLSCAFKFLHNNHVIYRDIKPDNIGFDVRGDVKIFDFGLAKEFLPGDRKSDGTFNFTGDTGSPRYMAPEVFLSQPYNETCDVYSFSILMWQILKVETPFEGFNSEAMVRNVYKGHARPKIDSSWSPEIHELLQKGWTASVKDRIKMDELSEVLRDIISSETDEGLEDHIDTSNKSMLSLNGRD